MSEYVGIPFEHNGRDRGGIDCLGLIKLYLDEHDLSIPGNDNRAIEQDWYKTEPDRLLRGLREYMEPVEGRPQKFDVLLFKMKGIARHLGVMTSRNYFLHIHKNDRSTRERLSKWQDHLEAIFRHKERI